MVKSLTLPYSLIGGRKNITTTNPQMLKLQAFFKKIVESSAEVSPIIRRIEKRLRSTNRVRQPVKISALVKSLESGKAACVVAKVLDDERILELPKGMKIVALKWSHAVQRKIEAHGGKIFTIDQFLAACEKDVSKLQFIETEANQRNSAKYWGLAPGEKGSTAYPRGNLKTKNHEKRINQKQKPQLKLEE